MRTRAQIEESLAVAKVKVEQTEPSRSTVISFASELPGTAVRLIEVDEEMVESLQKGGRGVEIRGESSGTSAVLTVGNRSLDLKECVSSNTLLLINRDVTSAEVDCGSTVRNDLVTGVFHCYLEGKPRRPSIARLYQCLSREQYAGPGSSEDSRSWDEIPSFEQLLDIVQCSERELHELLEQLRVIYVDGKPRLVNFEYYTKLATHLLNLIEENSWDWRRIPSAETLDTLAELEPRDVLNHSLRWLVDTNDDDSVWSLNERSTCRLFAEILLCAAGKFSLADFTATWEDSVPDGMVPTLEMISDLSVVQRDDFVPFIQFVPMFELPDDPQERFDTLFKIKPKWALDEIRPFLAPICYGKCDVNFYLLKYARSSAQGAVKVYSSRRPTASR